MSLVVSIPEQIADLNRMAAESRERDLIQHLAGLRAGIEGKVATEGPTCKAFEDGKEEGVNVRANILGNVASLRREWEDHRASSLRIRTRLAPLLGVDVNNEPADEMVGRFVALYDARDERVAEKRGHDKAMEWVVETALNAAGDEMGQRAAALYLFADNLRGEVHPPARGTVAGVEAAAQEVVATEGPIIACDIASGPETVAQHLYRGTDHRPGDVPVATRYREVDGSWGRWVQTVKAEAGAVGHVADALPPSHWRVEEAAGRRAYTEEDWVPMAAANFFYLPSACRVRMWADSIVEHSGERAVFLDAVMMEKGLVNPDAAPWDQEMDMCAGYHNLTIGGRRGLGLGKTVLEVQVVKESGNEPLSLSEIAAVRALLKMEGK